MLSPLSDPTYRRLFLAQLLSLLGTGLATVALGLLAFELAGADAGAVLGTALAIKMVAYVGIAPVDVAFVHLVPRRVLLVALDVLRAAVAVCLPFVSEVWQIYALIFVLQSGSAAFTPTFQATIPDILPDEGEYTKALSLSRLAYDLEALASPAVAAALLGVIGFHWLFGLNALGFLASAALVLPVVLPSPKPPATDEAAWGRTTRGARIYLATPRLRGLLALNISVAAAGAMVIVNTVVLVRAGFGLGEREVAWTLAAYGLGSMAAALVLPRLLGERVTDRAAMLAGAAFLVAGLLVAPAVPSWPWLLPDVVTARPGQRAGADAGWAAAATVGTSGRPSGVVRRPVRPQRDLSGGPGMWGRTVDAQDRHHPPPLHKRHVQEAGNGGTGKGRQRLRRRGARVVAYLTDRNRPPLPQVGNERRAVVVQPMAAGIARHRAVVPLARDRGELAARLYFGVGHLAHAEVPAQCLGSRGDGLDRVGEVAHPLIEREAEGLPPLSESTLCGVQGGEEDAVHPARLAPDRGEAVGPERFGQSAVALHQEPLVLRHHALARLVDLARRSSERRLPHGGPDLAHGPPEGPGVPSVQERPVGVVVEEAELRTPVDGADRPRVEAGEERRAEGLRPGQGIAERRRRPVATAHQRAHLAAAGEEVEVLRHRPTALRPPRQLGLPARLLRLCGPPPHSPACGGRRARPRWRCGSARPRHARR